MPDLEIEGVGTVEVDDSFTQLSPEQQNSFVENIINQVSLPKPEKQGVIPKSLEAAGDFAKGIPQGLGRAFVGGIQAATDLGEAGARVIEKGIYGDTMDQETFGKRLASEVGRLEEKQAKLPTAERIGIGAGEIAPYLSTGLGTGKAILAKTGSKVLGTAGAGAVGGGVSTGLSSRPEAGLGERVEEAARGAGVGGVVGGALGLAGKAVGGVKKLFTAKKPEDILARGLSSGQAQEVLQKLQEGGQDVILPDVAGDSMKGLTRALGKTKGGKDIISDALEGRSQKALTRVRNELTKVSPVDSYFGSLDDLAKARSEIAAPLYKKAFDQGTTLDVKKNKALFDKIAPDIADARKKFRIGSAPVETKNTALNRQELLARASGDSGLKDEQALIEVADSYKKALTQFNQNKPKRLIQYIKENGGISDFKGELKSLGVTNKTLPGFLRKEGSKGVNIDDIGIRLQEAGFFEERPTINQIIDLIERDVKGKNVFVPAENQQLYDDAAAYLEQFDRSGIDIEAINLLKSNKDQFLVQELNKGKIPDNSIIMLDAAKKSLDDKIGAAMRGGERQQASVLIGIKKELVNKLDELNPDYKKARQIFSDFSSIENAQQQGLQFNKLRPEQLKRYIKDLTPSEQEAFRIGVRENLDKMTSKATTSPARKIFGNTEIQDQLKAIFPDTTSYNQFKKRMLEEINFTDTKFKVLGGSRTDINLASEEEFLNKVAEFGAAGVTGGKSTVIGAAIRSLKNKFNGISEKNAKQLATILVNKGKSIDTLEKILAKESDQGQKKIIRDLIKTLRPDVATTKVIEEKYGN